MYTAVPNRRLTCRNNVRATDVTLGIHVRDALDIIPFVSFPIYHDAIFPAQFLVVIRLSRAPVGVDRTRAICPLEMAFLDSVSKSNKSTRFSGQQMYERILLCVVDTCQFPSRSLAISLHLGIR